VLQARSARRLAGTACWLRAVIGAPDAGASQLIDRDASQMSSRSMTDQADLQHGDKRYQRLCACPRLGLGPPPRTDPPPCSMLRVVQAERLRGFRWIV